MLRKRGRKVERPVVMGVSEIVEFTGVQKPNVGKMLERNGVEPLPVWSASGMKIRVGGRVPVYDFREIEAMQERRLAAERAREADERRRRTALKKAAKK